MFYPLMKSKLIFKNAKVSLSWNIFTNILQQYGLRHTLLDPVSCSSKSISSNEGLLMLELILTSISLSLFNYWLCTIVNLLKRVILS